MPTGCCLTLLRASKRAAGTWRPHHLCRSVRVQGTWPSARSTDGRRAGRTVRERDLARARHGHPAASPPGHGLATTLDEIFAGNGWRTIDGATADDRMDQVGASAFRHDRSQMAHVHPHERRRDGYEVSAAAPHEPRPGTRPDEGVHLASRARTAVSRFGNAMTTGSLCSSRPSPIWRPCRNGYWNACANDRIPGTNSGRSYGQHFGFRPT